MSGANVRAVQRGLVVAGIVWLALSIEIYLSNVAFPSKTDDDAIPVLVSYLSVFAAFIVIGLLGARAGASVKGRAVAGLIAGALLGACTAGTFFLVDNVWLDVVSQQPQKIAGFAASGDVSMREFINKGLIGSAVFLTVFFGVAGAVLGMAGGQIRRSASSPAAGPHD